MSPDLWSYTLKTYARPGVEPACLQLQAAGANVCLLLCAAWLGGRGVACNSSRLSQLHALAAPWHEEVVQPLRQLRTGWRQAANDDHELKALREQVKALELQAERQLLLRLEALARDWPQAEAEDLWPWVQGLAAEAANLDRDALQALRVAVTGA
ncbi:TIGR02444 family protein [Pseudomonas sp. TH05]|uniref:TIGR02444 family protein n=1 Tax=unclassified Pseudomonas TaxID=196821 RepID=UPI0009960926|nr:MULTISPECIES: TIGR02444 family protein [unclassified Pseudomonas]MBK5537881.1 TIGR02444 family protein [Pseudomonas sp. TH07]MBK5555948.1 TIGR02444 family protein [Pseudomonas sp. TH05]OOV97427.1 TIGR02444 family protein [Pseudomonas sp. MF4836]